MKKVTIMRAWHNPQIEIEVGDEAIGISMSLDDFITMLTDEIAEPTVAEVTRQVGNPALIMTNAQLQRRMANAIEGAEVHAIIKAAAERIVSAVKQETTKVM